MFKIGLIIGSLYCFLTVILGAFGAHALKDTLDEYEKSIFDKAVLYQMFHGVSILIVSIINNFFNEIDFSLVIWFFTFGVIIFSGSLYVLAITKAKWLGMITPIGGFLFIFGWLALIIKLLKV
tara:strand:- start:302 stop:670 length:369 start_codon:yes stop_codon:yes gene_type:complete